MTRVDLHCHSNCSDGTLSPLELLCRAEEMGIECLSITDHDTVAAYPQIDDANLSLGLVPGIEFSTRWRHIGIHVLGLNIDPHCETMAHAVNAQSEARNRRARHISRRLAKAGIDGALEGARSGLDGRPVGRPDFARFLVRAGVVRDFNAAFKRYLGDHRIGNVRRQWADLPQVIEWIHRAGGMAILAHPLNYRLTHTRLRQLVAEFAAEGGQGLEVITGRSSPERIATMAGLCRANKLLASCGSDFHAPGAAWRELGSQGPLPADLIPVWTQFQNP